MSTAAADRRKITTPPRWPLERVLFALAGSVTLTSAAAAAFLSPWFLLLTALVGINQLLFVTVGACPASVVLQRVFALPSLLHPQERPPNCGTVVQR